MGCIINMNYLRGILMKNIINFINKGINNVNNAYEIFSNFGPAKSLVIGFAMLIILGTLLLMLPFASQEAGSAGLATSLFTATSAVCVTGLVVVNTLANWTLFGKIVIILLIQIGGLGFMSVVTGLFLFLGKKITLKDRILIKESYNQPEITGMVKFVKNVFKGTFIIEGIGAFFLAIIFLLEGGSFFGSIGKGIFISISAFCNAGFDIIGAESLTPYQFNLFFNLVVMLLIIIGGIGFAVWVDVAGIREVFNKKIQFNIFIKRLTLHTKIVVIISTFLILSGTLFTFFVEYNNVDTIGSMTLVDKILTSSFQAVTLRTAGFNTIDLSSLKDSTKLFYMIQMFIGGSPGGTAGGVKTATIGVVIISIISAIKGRNRLEIFKRSLKVELLFKSLTVIILNLTVILVGTMILSISEVNMPSNIGFIELFFEVSSAVGTVGLTLGVTPYLSSVGQLVIGLCMFIGRLGPITIAVAFAVGGSGEDAIIFYPEEKIIVG